MNIVAKFLNDQFVIDKLDEKCRNAMHEILYIQKTFKLRKKEKANRIAIMKLRIFREKERLIEKLGCAKEKYI